MSASGARVELRRGSPLRAGKSFGRIAWWLLLLEVLLIPLLLTHFMPDRQLDWRMVWQVFVKVAAAPESWAMLAVLPPVTIYAWAIKRYERLIIADEGLEYRSPFQSWLAVFERFQPGWTLAWSQLIAAALLPPRAQRPIEWKLVLVAKPQSRELLPLNWIEATPGASGKLGLKDLLYRSPAVEAAVLASPLVRTLQARGYDLGETGARKLPSSSFDLLKDARSRVLLALLGATGAYVLVDAFLNPYRYVLPPAPPPYIAAGITVAVLGAFIGRGLPKLEHAVLAGLWAALAAAAMHCGMLRVNAWTDADGPARHAYRQLGAGHYAPVEMDLPQLEFAQPKEFWASTANGSRREFELTRGALEFWQLDMRPLHKQMREFFEEPRTKPAAKPSAASG